MEKTQKKNFFILITVAVCILCFLIVGVIVIKLKQDSTSNKTTYIGSKQIDNISEWNTYSSSLFRLTFQYPKDWFISEDTSAINIRIQNFDPKTAPGRGYDPIRDKGKYLLTVSKWVEGKPDGKNIFTIEELKLILPKNGESGFYMGEPVKQIFIENEKIFTINGYQAYSREKRYPSPINMTEYYTYILDGKGSVISVSPNLDVLGGMSQKDQILSTFRFID